MSFATKFKTALGKFRGPDEERILSHAEQEARVRSYEAARQHYIVQCEREERAKQKKRERRLNRRTNFRMSFYLFILGFVLVWVLNRGDEICAWWDANLRSFVQFIGG